MRYATHAILSVFGPHLWNRSSRRTRQPLMAERTSLRLDWEKQRYKVLEGFRTPRISFGTVPKGDLCAVTCVADRHLTSHTLARTATVADARLTHPPRKDPRTVLSDLSVHPEVWKDLAAARRARRSVVSLRLVTEVGYKAAMCWTLWSTD